MSTSKSQEQLIYDRAVSAMALMDATTALRHLFSVPPYQREIYLLAEEAGLNRSVVLGKFPKVSDSMKEKVNAGK